MAKISLAKAFTLRKRLRGIITAISDELKKNGSTYYLVSKTYPDGQVIEDEGKPFEYKGLNLSETYKLLVDGSSKIVILNNLIDQANVRESRKIINELEAEKDKVNILCKLAENRKDFKESISSYEETFYHGETAFRGGITTESFKLSNDDNWEKAYEDCRKKIMELEDELSDVNASTKFDVPDDILSFISTNA